MVRLRLVQEEPEPPSLRPLRRAEQAHDVALAHDEQRNAEVAEEDHADEGQDASEWLGQDGKREGQQGGDQQADHQPGQAGKQSSQPRGGPAGDRMARAGRVVK